MMMKPQALRSALAFSLLCAFVVLSAPSVRHPARSLYKTFALGTTLAATLGPRYACPLLAFLAFVQSYDNPSYKA